MSKQMKTMVLLVLFAFFLAAAVYAYSTLSRGTPPDDTDSEEAPGKAGEREGTEAPDFTVYDGDGKAVKLSELVGKPIVLNFWASWCPPCKGEMPGFEEVYGQVGDEVTFVMVDLVDGQRETQEKGSRYVKAQGFSFPVYYDLAQEAAVRYGINSIPRTYFIDKDGDVIAGVERALSAKALRQNIDRIR